MKKILLSLSLCTLSAVTLAAGINATNGFYAGGQANVGSYQPMDGAAFDSSVIPVSLYLRPYLGFRFNDYVALEAGYNNLVNDSNKGGYNNGLGILGPDHYRLYAIDVSGKFIYPFESGFSLYGKAGFAYAHQDVFNQTYIGWLPSVDSVTSKILPLFGVGVSYNFNQNVATELSYTRIVGNHPIGDINLIGLGFKLTHSIFRSSKTKKLVIASFALIMTSFFYRND